MDFCAYGLSMSDIKGSPIPVDMHMEKHYVNIIMFFLFIVNVDRADVACLEYKRHVVKGIHILKTFGVKMYVKSMK